jgi:TolB-like protein
LVVGVIIVIATYQLGVQSTHSTLDNPLNNTLNQASTINIAVQPFINMSDDPSQQLFIDGLGEEVVNSLTKIPKILVVSHTTKPEPNYLLQGSVRKDGNKLRIMVRLLQTRSGAYLFSTNFDRTVKDVFSIQRQISEQVAAVLKLSLVHKDSVI